MPAVCQGSPALSAKYGMSEDNRQDIVQVRNRVTEDVAWFNARRKQKPQQFVRAQRDQERAQASSSPCDFCEPHWRTLTAQDVFGRIEGAHCVTASNLFKYVAPYQGLVFLKHKHDALDFSLEELMDYLNVSARWFGACKEEYKRGGNDPAALTPMVIWNSGERSGASQKHSHIQLLYAASTFPHLAVHDRLTAGYDGDYYGDLIQAHREIGLCHVSSSACAFAHVAPYKNRELYVVGEHGIECPDTQTLIYTGLRAMISMGTTSFNMGIYSGGDAKDLSGRIVCRMVSRGQAGSKSVASDWGGLEVFGNASIAHDDPYSVQEAFDLELQKQPCVKR